MNLYEERDKELLGSTYLEHLDHMTTEGLHSKSDIAAELAVRDKEIASMRSLVLLISWLVRMNGCRLQSSPEGELYQVVSKGGEVLHAHPNLNRVVVSAMKALQDKEQRQEFPTVDIDEDFTEEEFNEANVQYEEGELIPTPDDLLIQTCCDCGLTHKIVIEADGARIYGDERLTKWARARGGFPLVGEQDK